MPTTDHKIAETQHDISKLIQRRWSPRAFSDQPIPEEELQALFEAASWAASSYNEQPWQYLYAHRSDEAGFQRLLSCIKPGNQAWAQNAAVLVLSSASTVFSRNGKTNRHALHDTGAANAYLLLEATRRDIYGHAMAGFDYDKTVQEFELVEPVVPVCFLALGHLGDPEQLEEPLRSSEQKPRQRQSVDSFTQKIQ